MQKMSAEEELDHAPLEFGKYKGKTASDVADIDSAYVVWLYDSILPRCVSHALARACTSDARVFGDKADDAPRFK